MFPPSVNDSPGRELGLVLVGFAALTIALTYPLAFHLGTVLYRYDTNLDGQFSVWNIAWVARALVIDPVHVLDANIFYPHRGTLAYSETNLGAGALAVPVYWATGNPFAAHNFVLLLSFVLSATGMRGLPSANSPRLTIREEPRRRSLKSCSLSDANRFQSIQASSATTGTAIRIDIVHIDASPFVLRWAYRWPAIPTTTK